MRRTIGRCLVSLCAASAMSQSFAALKYVAVPLPTLGGVSSTGTAINASGQVTGYAATPANALHAFVFSGSEVVDVGTLPGTVESLGLGINDHGQVAAWANTPNTSTGFVSRPFVYSSGFLTEFAGLQGGSTVVFGINASGQLVGNSAVGLGAVHAYLHGTGGTRDLGTLGGLVSSAYAINDQGVVVGSASTSNGEIHAFRWIDPVMIDLGTLGGTHSFANAVNGNGFIAGEAMLTGDVASHAVLYANGSTTDLGTLGGKWSSARGINNDGWVVGTASLPGDSTWHAFLVADGAMHDLNSLVVSGLAGAVLIEALAINATGQVLANTCPEYQIAVGCKGFLLNLVETPGSVAPPIPTLHQWLLAILALLLPVDGLRRRR